MSKADPRCVLLANAHHGLNESVRGLLATAFDSVVMVADEVSLFESAGRLRSDLAVVDLVRRLRGRFPDMKIIIVSSHDQSILSRSVLAAGANAFVVKRELGSDLLVAADAVLAGRRYVSPTVEKRDDGDGEH